MNQWDGLAKVEKLQHLIACAEKRDNENYPLENLEAKAEKILALKRFSFPGFSEEGPTSASSFQKYREILEKTTTLTTDAARLEASSEGAEEHVTLKE